jgi:hypothetical protein
MSYEVEGSERKRPSLPTRSATTTSPHGRNGSLSAFVLENIDEFAERIARIESADAPTLIDGSVLYRIPGSLGPRQRCIYVVYLDR